VKEQIINTESREEKEEGNVVRKRGIEGEKRQEETMKGWGFGGQSNWCNSIMIQYIQCHVSVSSRPYASPEIIYSYRQSTGKSSACAVYECVPAWNLKPRMRAPENMFVANSTKYS
jgi:hypothetical protein